MRSGVVVAHCAQTGRNTIVHIHILGICGTFMAGLAQLAIGKGLRVTGCDQNVYPPMSDQLAAAGIEPVSGYSSGQLSFKPDLWVVGNAMSRGNALVEAILDSGQPYVSGPEFLKQQILADRWVMAIAGTHGKTSTSSMLAWILKYAGFQPGFLIGGVPCNFDVSAQLGDGDFFVIEADEYDTAFFDKRSKFVHYLPRTLVLNNLEFDHADIFADLEAIERQFHHLIRIVPGDGQILAHAGDRALGRVLEQGCWTPVEWFAAEADGAPADWLISDEGRIRFGDVELQLSWNQLGRHNRRNAVAAIAAAHSVGVDPEVAVAALAGFRGVQQRMELIGEVGGCRIYYDFAHHPTAIRSTLEGLRTVLPGGESIVAVIEPRSNTMKMGIHADSLIASVASADRVYWYQPSGLGWNLAARVAEADQHIVESDFDRLLSDIAAEAAPGRHILIMSNGGFMGLHQKLLARLGIDDHA